MRATFCSRYNNDVRREIWFTESSSGIYLGFYTTSQDIHHHSIHTDGTRHLRDNAGKDLMPPSSYGPLKDIDGPMAITNANIGFGGMEESRTRPYSVTDKADVLHVIDVDAPNTRVHFHYYLMKRENEEAFLLGGWTKPHDFPRIGKHEIGLLLTVSLEFFPTHKVGFVLHKPL